MITNYNQFVNEEIKNVFGDELDTNKGLFGSLKNLFGKLMKNISDELKKPVEDLTKKLNNSKDIKNSKKLLNDYLRIHNESLKTSLDNSNTPTKIVKSVEDNVTAIYAALDAATKSLGENYTFEQMFSDSPGNIQKLFNKDEKKFNKNVASFSKNLVLSLGKQFGITKDSFTNEEDQTTENKLHEEIDTNTNIDPTKDTLTDDQAEELTKEPDDKPDDKPDEVQENKEEDQNIINLKSAIIKWFQNFIYKPVETDLKKDKSKNKEQTGSLEDKIKNTKGTDKPESINKIIDKLTQVDKQLLKQVRDLLGLTVDDTPL